MLKYENIFTGKYEAVIQEIINKLMKRLRS